MLKNRAIIQASSRSEGNSRMIAKHINSNDKYDFFDLNKKEILHFDYDFNNRNDDFFPLIQELIAYDRWILISPVYWYTMSGRMKVFFDRLSDLLKIYKDTGRKLRGKSIALISCSEDEDLNEAFEIPVKLSAEYLGMTYLGHVHAVIRNGQLTDASKIDLKKFIEQQ
ncbi:MAG: FMN reductase [Saprospiraceae bacterium]|nr:NAD(P)H-dependent oxidoreductase [Bacteroidia bacterium]NNF22211.1 FMN reductase [Saprospiraceae bacterium]